MMTRWEAHCCLLQSKKNNQERQWVGILACLIFSNWVKKLKDNDELGVVVFCKWGRKAKRRWQAGMLVVVSSNPRETNIKIFFLGLQKRKACHRFLVFCVFFFFSLSYKRWQQVEMLIIVFCNARKKQKTRTRCIHHCLL